jgi:hypothetical protein
MATLREVNEQMSKYYPQTDYDYKCRLFVDSERDTATLYVKINNRVEVRFGFVDPYKKQNLPEEFKPKMNLNAILTSTDQPVADMEVELFCPVEDTTDFWQANIEYAHGRDIVMLVPTGKKNGLVASNDTVNVVDLLNYV